MTPAARLSAAIAILDRVLSGAAVEQSLINWGRASRYAGSGDRNAVRDLVFDALRCRRSYAALGGGLSGRGLMLGALRAAGTDPALLFTAEGHAPALVRPDEVMRQPSGAEALDVPDWLLGQLTDSLGDDLLPVAQAFRQRAPVFLRVNIRRTSVAQAMSALQDEGISTQPHALADTALEVTDGARKIQPSQAYQSGFVELQDVSSQAVVNALPLRDGMRVLDHCAGGGGKTLAMAARAELKLYAHDAAPARMKDVMPRASRAGVKVVLTQAPETLAPYDLILADVPCSGSGSWRRDPQGKWLLTQDRLEQTGALQDAILDRLAPLTKIGGVLAYATCSILRVENEDRIAGFLARHPDFCATLMRRFTSLEGGDGFFTAQLTRVGCQSKQL